MFRTVLANISRRKLRMLGTSIAVLLGVMFTSGTLVLTDSLNSAFDNLFTDTYAKTSAVVRSSDKIEGGFELSQSNTRADMPESMVKKVADIDSVDAAEGTVSGYSQIIKPNGKALGNPNQGPPTMGLNWITDKRLNPLAVVDGRAPERDGEVVLDRFTAKESGYKVGDKIPIITPSGRITRTVVGLVTVAGNDGAGGATMVTYTLADAQKVLLLQGKVNEIRVAAATNVTPSQVVASIQDAHLPSTEVITAALAAQQNKDAATAFLSFFSVFLLVFAAIALLVGAFIIANTFSILVAQRTQELALLRAIGASRRQVLLSVVAEAAVVGLIASILGLGLGYLIASGLQQALLGDSSLVSSAVVTPRTVVFSFVIGVGITVLSALLPARRAARVPPVTAMREAAVEDTSGSRRRTIIGVVFAVATAAFLLFGSLNNEPALTGIGAVAGLVAAVTLGPILAAAIALSAGSPFAKRGMPGRLGQQNVLRNPKRTASTASALMIGATLVCAIAVFAASALASINQLVDTRFHGAVVITSTGNGLPLTDIDKLTSDPSFGTVAAMSFAPVEINGKGTLVSASDPAAITDVVDMEVMSGNLDHLGDKDLAVSEAKAKDKGWRVGTTVDARFVNGTTRKMTVRAIYRNRLVAQDIFASIDAVRPSLVVPMAQIAFISGTKGTSPQTIKAEVDKLLAHNPTAKVQTNAEFKTESAAQMNSFLMIVYAMLALAVIIAIIGIVNTLGLSVMERVRELGLLRAVGMTKRQLRTTVRVEALLIAVTGTVIGIVLGTAIGASLIKSFGPEQALTGFAIPFPTIITVLVAGVFVGLFAAIIPARRAARLDPLRALAAE